MEDDWFIWRVYGRVVCGSLILLLSLLYGSLGIFVGELILNLVVLLFMCFLFKKKMVL